MNAIDRAIATIAPGFAVRRAKSRAILEALDNRRAAYSREAARASKDRRSADQRLDHADSRMNHADRIQCMREARSLCENHPVVKSMMMKMESYVVGRLSYTPRTGIDAANVAYKTYIQRWMENADFTGRRHFRAMMGLGVMGMARDGDAGWIEYSDDSLLNIMRGICPVRLLAVEADRIGNQGSADNQYGSTLPLLSPTEREYSGVVVDAMTGQPKRYRITSRRETDGRDRVPPIEIPAESFYLLAHNLRSDSYRGFSMFDAGINSAKDSHELLLLEMISQKYLASISYIIKNEDGTANENVVLDDVTGLSRTDLTPEEQLIKPGQAKYIDGTPTVVPNNRPSTTFGGFHDTTITSVGLSLNLPFGFVYRWSTNGTAVRMDAAQADREFSAIQQRLEESVLNRVKNRVLATGITLGHIKQVPNWDQGEWSYPRSITADLGRESKSIIDEKQAGLTSAAVICHERGYDYGLIREAIREEAMNTVNDAKEIVAQHPELNLDQAIYLLEKRGPNAPVAPVDAAPAAGD